MIIMPLEEVKKKTKLFPFHLYRKRSGSKSKGKSKSLLDLYGGEGETEDKKNDEILRRKRLSHHENVVLNSSLESNGEEAIEAVKTLEGPPFLAEQRVLNREDQEENREMDVCDGYESEERDIDLKKANRKADEAGEADASLSESETIAKAPEFPPGTTAALAWKSNTCSLFQMEVEIREGLNLIARDRSGTSDPYVKAKFRGKCVYKSKIVYKNLNPVWNEKFSLFFDDVNANLVFKVYDFDRLSSDDQMGVASLNVSELEINRSHTLNLDLINRTGLQEDLGQIVVSVLITAKGSSDEPEPVLFSHESGDIHKLGLRVVMEAMHSADFVFFRRLTPEPVPKIFLNSQKDKDTSVDSESFNENQEEIEEVEAVEAVGIIKSKSWASSSSLFSASAHDERRKQIQNLTRSVSTRYQAKRGSRVPSWDGVVAITLVEGSKLNSFDDNGFSDPYCKFKLGNEKHKTKFCKATLNPQWKEKFELRMYHDVSEILEIQVWDKDPGRDEFMGRCAVDLLTYERERTHFVQVELEDNAGLVSFYMTITALSVPGSVSDLSLYMDQSRNMREEHERDFTLKKTWKKIDEIGWLQIRLHRAVGLASADIGGASDPFAVIEVNNQRVLTPTVYKTLNPHWEKVYEMPVYDIHETISLTIYDEDRRGAPEFLGRVGIPLLTIVPQEKRIYQLKDKNLERQAKGHVIITFDLVYNPIRASIRTFNPREINALHEPPRFRRQLLQQNVDRLSNIIKSIIATGQFIQSLFTWKYKLRSAFAFILYVLLVLNFELFFLPLILLLILLKNYIVFMLSPDKEQNLELDKDSSASFDDDDDEDDLDEKNKKTKGKSLRERLEAVTNICTTVQNQLDFIASFAERIKNTFNWSVPFCSYLLMVILSVGTILLYFLPLRYILLAWGVNKFTKKIRKPNAVGNNELLDFLSRIPSDPELKQRRRLKTDMALR